MPIAFKFRTQHLATSRRLALYRHAAYSAALLVILSSTPVSARTDTSLAVVETVLRTSFDARITDDCRPMSARYGARNSHHKYCQAVDFVPRAGLASITRDQIRAEMAANGIPVVELLGPGDPGHADHWHLAFGSQGTPRQFAGEADNRVTANLATAAKISVHEVRIERFDTPRAPAPSKNIATVFNSIVSTSQPSGPTPQTLANDFQLLQAAPSPIVRASYIPNPFGSGKHGGKNAWKAHQPLSAQAMLAFAPDPARDLGQQAAYACGWREWRPSGLLPAANEDNRRVLYPYIRQAACDAGLPVPLLDALIIQESAYDPGAISPKGAVGLGQLMPTTAAHLGVNHYDIQQNLIGAARFLRTQIDAFGSPYLALAAYNAGPGRVRRSHGLPHITETRRYAASVIKNWVHLQTL